MPKTRQKYYYIKKCKFICYELDTWSWDLNVGFTLKYCLFGAIKLTANAGPGKCLYFGCAIGFDSCSLLSFPNFYWV